jgi:hypothetical protein
MKMTVFWEAASCSLKKFTDISGALSASIIRMMVTVSLYLNTWCIILEDRHHLSFKVFSFHSHDSKTQV